MVRGWEWEGGEEEGEEEEDGEEEEEEYRVIGRRTNQPLTLSPQSMEKCQVGRGGVWGE